MKLTRQATILFFSIGLIGLFALGFFLGGSHLFSASEPAQQDDSDQYSVVVVAENQKIVSTYIDSIPIGPTAEAYTPCLIDVPAGLKVGDYEITNNQTFTKYIQLYGPDGKEVITNKSKQTISHYAYSMLLTGDVIEKTNMETKEVIYEITNARITYNRIPFVLLRNENSVCLRNKNKTEEKIIKLQEFTDALKSTKNRDKVISW